MRLTEPQSRTSFGPSTMGPGEEDQSATFLMDMAKALSSHGSPAHSVEQSMELCAKRLGLKAEFFSIPTAVYATLGEDGHARTYLRRVPLTSIDVARLGLLDEVVDAVSTGCLSVSEGLRAMRSIEAAPRRDDAWWAMLVAAVSCAAVAPLFQGGVREALGAGLIGLVVAMIQTLIQAGQPSRRVLDFAAGFVAAVIAGLLARAAAPLSYEITLISGLIVLMPGLTVTMAGTELATVNLVSGTARLVGAVSILISIGFGVALAQHLLSPLGPISGGELSPLPWTWTTLALIIGSVSISLLLGARTNDLPWLTIAGGVGYGGALLGAVVFGPQLGAWLGAFGIGLFSNILARCTRRPAVAVMVPGIILLVPGSVGFRSLTSFLADDALTGLETAFEMVIVAAAIVTGLLLANAAFPSRRTL